MTAINESQVKVLEQTRQRLLHLTHSLDSLTGSLHQSDPLPSWSSLQSQASIISNNLINICSQLAEHQELLSSLVAYPAPSFPTNTQQGVLEQLLRTKLDPRVEDWVTRGRIAGTEASLKENGGLSDADLAELWSWAPVEANQEARRRNWGGNYTLEEKELGIQNVVTGLKRALPDDDDEEDEDEDEEFEDVNEDGGENMEIVGVHTRPGAGGVEFDIAGGRDHVPSASASPALPLDEVFRYMMTGMRPKSGA
ncbi:RNA polymerase II mediator complex component Med8, putative [Talaromyces stipitatus ATCC 10500]|uniref:Mediator of RNA polymerase II transcription subunit 8 n=1 Tax=Talaromyces stipitatus (strain ATCC 10500 / CBS 375.48 / QM 6759 / NRRL 1006) TaxID=441959 RepID=B8MGE1_TALSN|nr:RNA polymerase II mediator complex component Med8, putative [Talaromyces stipitatus ATCC 10500]EED16260.1 RNA polymerase II mediator complex component Med8, putative [Talaromyces stipitatus ATCC 10500]